MLPENENIRIPANDSLEQLDRDMAKKSLDGFWRVRLSVPAEPTTNVKPFLWKWADCYESLVRALFSFDASDALTHLGLMVVYAWLIGDEINIAGTRNATADAAAENPANR